MVMALLAPSISVLCCLIVAIQAASLRVSIPASHVLPNPNALTASTHAVLTSGAGAPIRAILKKGNYFDFTDIPTSGPHLLDIYSRDYVFAPYRIDITPSTDSKTMIAGAWETYRGSRWEDRGVPLVATPTEQLSMSAKVLGKKDFLEERQGFNPMSLLKNPMILMGVVALAFTFGMPKLMENMDPEMKAEYEEMQKKGPMAGLSKAMQGQGSASNAVGDFDLAGYLSGSTKSSGNDRGPEGARERRR